jgi:hypothetical protein
VPASAFAVLAGASDGSNWTPGVPPPAGTQSVNVSSRRIHPYYDHARQIDDVMILTLASALSFGADVQPISLAQAGSAMAPGAPLRVTGFGQSSPDAATDGKLRALDLTAIGDDACRTQIAGDASVVCAQAPNASACHGDSGGALTTTGSPPAQVGVVSYGPSSGCGTGPTTFADVTAPEIRAFLDGATDIPRAPRVQRTASISGVMPPVQGSPLTCDPGSWEGAATLTYTFEVDGIGALQSGPSTVYIPQAKDVGMAILCRVDASNGGGVSASWSGTMPALGPDTVAPSSQILSLRCRRRSCATTVGATDSNSRGVLSLTAAVRYRVGVKCGHKRRCTRIRHRSLPIRTTSPGRFAVVASKLPYGRVTLRFRAYDAVGNRQRVATAATVVVRQRRRHR